MNHDISTKYLWSKAAWSVVGMFIVVFAFVVGGVMGVLMWFLFIWLVIFGFVSAGLLRRCPRCGSLVNRKELREHE